MTGIHQADFLGALAADSIAAAAAEKRPFYIQLNPVMVCVLVAAWAGLQASLLFVSDAASGARV